MFKLIIFASVAFVIGMVFQRNLSIDACLDAGGTWQNGVCAGVEAHE